MPELPEVEHVRRRLARWMKGARIVRVDVLDTRMVRPTKPAVFVDALTGRTVTSIERRGKWLRLRLDDDHRVFAHLGMTGWFEHERAADRSNPHAAVGHHLRFERVRFVVTKRAKRDAIVYVDPRRWGRLIFSRDDIASWTDLGPDPLADGIDLDALAARLARRKRASIKEVLMDQTVIAGIGNIQAAESLWKAGIDPRSPASRIGRADLVKLAAALRWTIERTLKDLAGHAKSPFRVYGRNRLPCSRCGATLERFELGGRTTTYCPACQRPL
jgi:formamidopyrimidine-DNA glycosylase